MFITKFRLVVIGLVVIGLICLTYAVAQHQNEGDKPYTPTRLQWLAVQLNSFNVLSGAIAFVDGDIKYVSFVEKGDNTLEMIVLCLPGIERKVLDKVIDTCKAFAINTAQKYGWDTWLIIKESVQMIE